MHSACPPFCRCNSKQIWMSLTSTALPSQSWGHRQLVCWFENHLNLFTNNSKISFPQQRIHPPTYVTGCSLTCPVIKKCQLMLLLMWLTRIGVQMNSLSARIPGLYINFLLSYTYNNNISLIFIFFFHSCYIYYSNIY